MFTSVFHKYDPDFVLLVGSGKHSGTRTIDFSSLLFFNREYSVGELFSYTWKCVNFPLNASQIQAAMDIDQECTHDEYTPQQTSFKFPYMAFLPEGVHNKASTTASIAD